MSQSRVPPQKRKRVDSLEPEAPSTSLAEASGKKLKLSTKLTSRSATTSSCITAWVPGATRPASLTSQASLAKPASSKSQSSEDAKQFSSTSKSVWRPKASKYLVTTSTPAPIIKEPPYTSVSSPANSTSSSFKSAASSESTKSAKLSNSSSWAIAGCWRTTMGVHKPQAPISKTAKVGEIWWMPLDPTEVPIGEPIHEHPDFRHASAWGRHPALVIERPDDKGYLKCFQVTSFGGFSGGLEEKYAGFHPDMIWQRNRWLLVEDDRRQGHDNLPVLKLEKGTLAKVSYINTEKYFKIKTEHLITSKTRPFKLTKGSVDIAVDHHYKYYHDLKQPSWHR